MGSVSRRRWACEDELQDVIVLFKQLLDHGFRIGVIRSSEVLCVVLCESVTTSQQMIFIVCIYTPRREVCHVNAVSVRYVNQVDGTQHVGFHDFALVSLAPVDVWSTRDSGGI